MDEIMRDSQAALAGMPISTHAPRGRCGKGLLLPSERESKYFAFDTSELLGG